MTNAELTARLLLQLVCLLIACRAVGWAIARFRQPQVVGEMLAGFLLGPSFFGWIAPGAQAFVFPPESMSVLYVISQIGLVLYMFCVGLEFHVQMLRAHGRTAVAVSAAGIAVPFALGGLLALALLRAGGLFAPGVTAVQAVLFMGAAMSITAFPMLARIISERGISGTAVGSLALAAGAINDAAAWIILAMVLSLFTGSRVLPMVAAGGAVVYVVAVLVGLRPLLRRMAAHVQRRDTIAPAVLSSMLGLLALGAWFTDLVGVHAVFGAFLFGAATPRGLLSEGLRRTIEPLTTALLVPLFFVYSGLNTQLGLVSTAMLWVIAAVIFLSACLGKGAGCWGAARLAGAGTRDALGVATLMNCRGMVELILLNIGLQRGLITPTLFTMMVLMAISTTLMTGPLFSYVWERSKEPALDSSLAAERPS